MPSKKNYKDDVLNELVGPAEINGYPTAHIYLTVKAEGESRPIPNILGIGRASSMCGANLVLDNSLTQPSQTKYFNFRDDLPLFRCCFRQL